MGGFSRVWKKVLSVNPGEGIFLLGISNLQSSLANEQGSSSLQLN